MGGMSIWHWIIVGGVLLLLFGGKGKVSDLMGDFAKGIKSFKKGMADDDVADAKAPITPVTPVNVDQVRSIDHQGKPIEKTTETHRVV
ncbi:MULTISPECIES: twin-arginine translocase TatA/TatE family subunit [Lichenihabitans]|uniref:twin-arginine translocase TatA/TatE family subunit n=1 Tax=Lichenihabitans TaxID=2723776 RepID=UPI0010367D11|nr:MULTISPECIES: twin-arginine translocase TatA/TatE family subunit [Lichenihabitans]UDL95389.1 twin-arginine translocase TatA/TatE family subunit [Lichenihabitans sp. PAMC28606]